MKRVLIILVSAMTFAATSCGSLGNLSYDDYYNIGWDIGYYGTKLLNN